LIFKASWVYQCDDGLIHQLEAVLKLTPQQNSLQKWAALLKGVVAQALKPYKGKHNFSEAAKHVLLKWALFR
jgi:hypothetical protein